MSIGFQTTDGKTLEAPVAQILPGEEVRIGEYEMSLEQFAGLATHLLVGGLFGWSGRETPKSINESLSILFTMYEKNDDGTWSRKEKYHAEPKK